MTTVQRATHARAAGAAFDAVRARAEFPILRRRRNGKPLVYLDNAATTQKPRAVIDTVSRYYGECNANVHRGVYHLSEAATAAYDGAREIVRRFLNAGDPSEIVFVRGTTEGINLVAQSFARPRLRPGDEIVVSVMEHHSNIVPWQIVCEATGAHLRVAPISDEGELLLDRYEALLSPRTRLVAIAHVSNALGTINPAREIVALAHARGIPVLLDGAQAAAHLKVDVQDLDCDFYAISGHKMFGPTGIGALYGKAAHLEAMPPYQGGGDMIRSVSFERTAYAAPPTRFEAGTPHIAGAVGLAAAVEYLEAVDPAALAEHEGALLAHATEALAAIPGVRLIGTARHKASVVSFVVEGVHPHDVGTVLDQEGVCVRTGHHCAQPLMTRVGVPATVRASFALYNTGDDLEALIAAMGRVRDVFGK